MVDIGASSVLDQLHTDLGCWSRGDTVGYGQSAAPDVTVFNNSPPSRRVDGRSAFLALLESLVGLIPEHTYELQDLDVKEHGDVSIVSFVYWGEMGDETIRARGTVVYVRGEDGWRMVHTHFSNMDGD